jgi:hypothetical protein
VGCQNADLLKPAKRTPAATDESGERAFTRIGEEAPGPLTSEVAYDWFDRIRAVEGQERLDLIDQFLDSFPAAQRLPLVHQMQGDALAAEQRLAEASDAYERALVLTRTDITGLPLDTELPLQLALTRLASGDVPSGTDWLLRVSIADRGTRVSEGLRWSFSTDRDGAGSFAEWEAEGRAAVAPSAPTFSLPGLLVSEVGLERGHTVTLVNFWSPT